MDAGKLTNGSLVITKRRLYNRMRGDYVRDDVSKGGAVRAIAQTYYTPDSTQMLQGIYIGLLTSIAGSGPITTTGHWARLKIPLLSVDETRTYAGWNTDFDSYLYVHDLKVYAKAGIWRVEWSSMSWYVKGVLEHTVAGGNAESTILTVSSCPLFGIAWEGGHNSSADQALTI